MLAGEPMASVPLTFVSMRFSVLPGFSPAGDDPLFRQKAPKPFPPSSARLNRADAGNGKGGPTRQAQTRSVLDLSVSPVGRSAGGWDLRDWGVR